MAVWAGGLEVCEFINLKIYKPELKNIINKILELKILQKDDNIRKQNIF